MSFLKSLPLLLVLCAGVPLSAQPKKPRGWLVWSNKQGVLQAQSFTTKKTRLLRSRFLPSGWAMSNDGKTTLFVAGPNVDFFSARATRAYLFEQRYNRSRSELVVGAYHEGKARFANRGGDPRAVSSTFDNRFLLTDGISEDYEQMDIGLYDPKNLTLRSLVDRKALPASLENYSHINPGLLPDGKTMVFVAEVARAVSSDGASAQQEGISDWSQFLVSYSLSTKQSRILLKAPQILDLKVSPDGKFCVFRQFLSKKSEDELCFQIMRFDFSTGQVRALTQPQNETDSQAVISPDGRFIAWLRLDYSAKDSRNRHKLALMNSDGSQPRPIRFDFAPEQMSWISSLPHWSRFSKFPVTFDVPKAKTN